VGPDVTILDSAATTADWVKRELERRRLLRPQTSQGRCRFMTTDNPERFAKTGRIFLGHALSRRNIALVDL
jgi:glutamate racemase